MPRRAERRGALSERAFGARVDAARRRPQNEFSGPPQGGDMKVFATAAALLCPLSAFAGMNNAVFFQVPTLGEFGLIGLIVAVSVAAGLVIRRRKK